MAAVDYLAIGDEIKSVLQAYSGLSGVPVVVEEDMLFNGGLQPWIGVYLDRRDPADNQFLDAGQSTRYALRFSIWCWCMSIENTRAAIQQRDSVLAKMEVALMGNRTLNNRVEMSWLLGGEMPSGKFEGDSSSYEAVYMSGGELVLLAVTTASTI